MIVLKRLKTKLNRLKGEDGFTLVEAIIAIALLGIVVLTMVIGMSTGAMAVSDSDEQVTAQGLARSQMEYTKNYTYNSSAVTYPAITAPDGYTITVVVSAVPDTDTNIQKITVTVARNGATLITLEDYKVNR